MAGVGERKPRDRNRSFAEDLSMKWMLVVLVGGVTPVQTDVLFENSQIALRPKSNCARLMRTP